MRQRSERWGGDYYHASAAAGATPVSFASVPTETMRLVAMAAYQAGGHCSTIANYAIPSTVDYKTIRESFVEDAFTSATLVIIGAYVKKVMLAGSIASVNFRVRTAERLYSRTRMHILAADWNSYNCHNRYVEAGPMWVTGGGGGGSPICEMMMLSISFNGGASWSDVNVIVCYVQHAY